MDINSLAIEKKPIEVIIKDLNGNDTDIKFYMHNINSLEGYNAIESAKKELTTNLKMDNATFAIEVIARCIFEVKNLVENGKEIKYSYEKMKEILSNDEYYLIFVQLKNALDNAFMVKKKKSKN